MVQVRAIEWWYFDPRTQAHGHCRYCEKPATMMVKVKRWTQVCIEHAAKMWWKNGGNGWPTG